MMNRKKTMRDGINARTARDTANEGITLLEAYSALAMQQGAGAAVDIPFPGQPANTDGKLSFWRTRVHPVG